MQIRILYFLFFENYTYKLWGIPAEEISAEWGAQRIQNLSAIKIIKNFRKNAIN